MKPMVSLELDDEALLDMACPIPIPLNERARFPYGMRIILTGDECAKVGIDPAEVVKDAMLHFGALARVTDVSHSDGEMGKRCRIELQIENMTKFEDEGSETDDAPKKRNPLHDNDRSI
jgi:hypothetical protein